MKYIWEAIDIKVGRLVEAHNRSERYIIAYDPTLSIRHNRYALVSLKDGMITSQNKWLSELMDDLNTHGYRPVDVQTPDIQVSSD